MKSEFKNLFKIQSSKKSKQAIIDLGSNSVRMLIYDDFKISPIPVFNEKAVCKLGKNLDKSKKLNPDGIKSSLKVLNRFKEILDISGVLDLEIIATAAFREATDASEFLEEIKRIFDKKPLVLSGEEEARTSANGVMVGFDEVDGLVADLGGGSLELARVSKNQIFETTSLPLGVLRLENNPIIKKRNLRKYVKKLLKDEKWLFKKKFKNIYLVGGTWRSLFKYHLFKEQHPLHILHQYKLTKDSAVKYLNKISKFNKSSLKSMEYITKSRTPYLPFSSIILNEIIEAASPSKVICSISGLREGHMNTIINHGMSEDEIFKLKTDGISFKKGDYGKSFEKYFNFISPLFEDNEYFNRRLLTLACILSKMDWGLGAFQKAELVFMEVLNTPLLKLEHRDRVKVASASFWRHCGLKYNPDYQFLSILNNNEILSSKQVGSALRLAESLTSMSSLLLDEFKIYKRNKTIFLKIPNNHSDIVSKQVTKRLKNLASEMNVDSNIIYS